MAWTRQPTSDLQTLRPCTTAIFIEDNRWEPKLPPANWTTVIHLVLPRDVPASILPRTWLSFGEQRGLDLLVHTKLICHQGTRPDVSLILMYFFSTVCCNDQSYSPFSCCETMLDYFSKMTLIKLLSVLMHSSFFVGLISFSHYLFLHLESWGYLFACTLTSCTLQSFFRYCEMCSSFLS